MSTQTTRRATGDHTPDEPEQASLASRLPEIAARAAWEHRWRLAPAYLASCTVVGVGTGHGLMMAGGLGAAAGAAAGAAELATRTQAGAGGRIPLSAHEARVAAAGLAGTGAWAVIASVTGLPWLLDAALLGGALAWPTHLWWATRRPEPEPEPEPSPYSLMAQRFFDGWTSEITVGAGPNVMRGSVPVMETLTEPAEGALTIEMQLAKGVPAKKAVSEDNRRAVEALFVLPEDTVRLETVREDSTRFKVIITASRHLEVEGGLDWPGPVLHENGDIPLAVTGDGQVIAVPLFRQDGIRHGMITGTTGVGKSITSGSILTPGVKAGLEIILYIDGKRGTSAPYLRPIIGRYARLPQQWPILIEIAYRIMTAREERRGALGLNQFDALQDEDPIITVFIDEPNAANKSPFFKAKHVRMVLEILEHGRAVGVRLIQCGQSPAGEDLIGGVQARGLMSGGWSVNHRAAGKGASRLTLDSSNATVSLLELPAGGAAITVGGKLVGFPAQVRNATEERVTEEVAGITLRELAGADLIAAAPEWYAAHWEDAFTLGYQFDPATTAPGPAGPTGPQEQQPGPSSTQAQEEDLPASRMWVLDQLDEHPDGLTLKQLEDLPGAPARRTITNSLTDLMGREEVTKSGAIWSRISPREAVDDPQE